jgi:hypothetical protein
MGRLHVLFMLPLALAAAGGWPQQPDRPPRTLVVSLRDDPPAPTEPETAAHSGSVTLSTGRPLRPDSYGNGQVLSTQAGRPSTEVLEGEPFRISMPASQSLWVGIRGGSAGRKGDVPGALAGGRTPARPDVAGVVHFDAVSDFTARVWLDGAAVAIELQPLAAGRVDTGPDASSQHVTVYGRVGQWIELAESGTDLWPPASGGSGAARAGVWIKVESAP